MTTDTNSSTPRVPTDLVLGGAVPLLEDVRCGAPYILPLLLLSIAVGCDGFTTVKGRVVDSTGKPITEAEVQLIYKPDDPSYRRITTARTDKKGYFEIGIVHSPSKNLPIRLDVHKAGFTEHAERLPSMASCQKEIVLQPVKK